MYDDDKPNDYEEGDEYCHSCGGDMVWCSLCQVWTSTCCVDWGTCMCS